MSDFEDLKFNLAHNDQLASDFLYLLFQQQRSLLNDSPDTIIDTTPTLMAQGLTDSNGKEISIDITVDKILELASSLPTKNIVRIMKTHSIPEIDNVNAVLRKAGFDKDDTDYLETINALYPPFEKFLEDIGKDKPTVKLETRMALIAKGDLAILLKEAESGDRGLLTHLTGKSDYKHMFNAFQERPIEERDAILHNILDNMIRIKYTLTPEEQNLLKEIKDREEARDALLHPPSTAPLHQTIITDGKNTYVEDLKSNAGSALKTPNHTLYCAGEPHQLTSALNISTTNIEGTLNANASHGSEHKLNSKILETALPDEDLSRLAAAYKQYGGEIIASRITHSPEMESSCQAIKLAQAKSKSQMKL